MHYKDAIRGSNSRYAPERYIEAIFDLMNTNNRKVWKGTRIRGEQNLHPDSG